MQELINLTQDIPGAPARAPGTAQGARATRHRQSWTSPSTPYLLIALPALGVLMFVGYPSVLAIVHSFQHVSQLGQATGFAGLANYQQLFQDNLFRDAVVNTAIYGSISVVLCVLIALAIALLIGAGRRRASKSLMLSLFSPTILPMIAAANIWLYLLAPTFGVIDRAFGWAGLRNMNLLGKPSTALGVLVALFLWKYVPYFTLFILAGLQAVPTDVWDAMRTEDPHHWYGFRRVVLPVLAPMLLFVTTMALLYAFETIDSVYVMTQGGPDYGTETVMYYLYQLGFNFFEWGPAGALTALLLVTFSTVSAIALISVERRTFHWQ